MFDAGVIAPSLILIAGVAEDLRTRKVRNALIGVFLAIAAFSQLALYGWAGLQSGLLGAATGLIVCLPLVLSRIIGAGDMKLMVAVGLATSWAATFTIIFWGLIWGAILGLLRAVIGGEFGSLVVSTYRVMMRQQATTPTLHKIPFTVALAFGWLSYLLFLRTRGGWL